MDPRRELSLINKHVRRRNREAGESIVWYEFQTLQGGYSVYDDVYDEGVPGASGRNYKTGIIIPTIYIEEVEDGYRAIEEGRQPVQNLVATILYKDAVAAGLSTPDEYNKHLNDMLEYDGRFYKVRNYNARGRLPEEVILKVSAYEVLVDQEFPFDRGPQNPKISTLPWPTSFPS
jgi:hypothetical protein